MAKKSIVISHQLKKLISLLSDNKYHSGTAIGEQFGLTRSGIWKLIKQLEDLGVEIESITNKGYKLYSPLELLDKSHIKKYMKDKTENIQKILIFDDLLSTNTYLMENANHFYGENVVCLAERQTAGRGRLGREWISPFATNIYLSLLWNFPFNISELAGLNVVIGVAVAEAIKEAAEINEIELKWPNDIYYQDNKLGGILIDIIGEYNGTCRAVIGIGINIYMPTASGKKIKKPWTDMFTISGKRVMRNKMTGTLLNKLIASLISFEKDGISQFIRDWNTMDYLSGKFATVNMGIHTMKGKVKGIDHLGHLILETNSGKNAIITTGDASVMRVGKETGNK